MLDLKASHLSIVKAILKKHLSTQEVWAFGSRVNGTAKPHSDLDLVVRGHSEIDPTKISMIRLEFEESNLPMRIDVLDWNSLSDEFRDIVSKSHIAISGFKPK